MTQTALITGASAGIGRALATEFASHGYDVVLVARNASALSDVARALSGLRHDSGQARRGETEAAGSDREVDMPRTAVHIIAEDLSRPGSAQALVERVQSEGLTIDVLVNNAGFGLQGEFAALPLDQQVEMIQLNVITLTALTHLLLPGMLERRTGGVLNVASTAAFQPGPLMAVYYATKAYVLSFTEAIAEEAAGRGVKVTALCPGPTQTEFAARARMTDTNLFKGSVMRVERVAREGFDGWNGGQVVVIPGAANRRGAMVVRLAPRALVRRIVKRMNSIAPR
jgi:short-subunit dehydrogenase